MSSILDGIQSYVTSEIVKSAASSLGESEGAIGKAIGGLAPTLLAGIIGQSGNASAMGNIFNLLSDKKSAGFLDNIGGLVGGLNNPSADTNNLVGGLTSALFGGKSNAILNALSSFAGLKSSSTSSLMNLVTPIVMGVISRKIASNGLNLGSLTKMLMGEKESIMKALPSGMGSVMGLADFGGNMPKVDINTPVVKTSTGSSWLWPLVLLVGLGLGAWYFLGTCNAPKTPVVDTTAVEQKVEDAAAAGTAAVQDAASAVVGFVKKIGDFELKGNVDGIESKLIAFIDAKTAPCKEPACWFSFDRLTFQTGSASLDMEKSTDQLTNIYQILKAYPTVRLKVGGYTDNTGNAANNKKLSQQRAEAVVAALVAMGVDKTRLEPEGYGSEHPVAPNDTEENKAKNRRIDVRVLAN